MAARILFTNNAQSVIAAGLAANGTSIILEAGKGLLFPNPTGGDYFKLTLEDRRINPPRREIVHCTARATDTLTISRAKEGTAAQLFNAGFVASLRMTAEAAQLLVDAASNFAVLWLGVHATAPLVDNEGNPLQVGSLYFDSTTNLNYAWDGLQWRSQLVPATGVTTRLFYNASAAQVNFGDTVDLYGNTLTLNPATPVPVLVFKNGGLLFLDDGSDTIGGYVVNYALNRIELVTPATSGDDIELQQLALSSTSIGVGEVDVRKLMDIDLDPGDDVTPGWINGARTTFELRDSSGVTVTPDSVLTLLIYLDGVPQEPGVNYTVSTSNVVFDEALPAGTKFWGVFYASMA